MNDANNAGTLLPCPFCGCSRIDVYTDDGDDLAANKHVYVAQCYNCGARTSPVIGKANAVERWNTRTLSTPNATVEPAGLKSLRHLLAHMPDKDLHLRRFDAQQLLQFIDAILAVRLDEAAIRKDEREKQREIDAKICDHVRNNAERCAADHTNIDAIKSALDKMEGAIRCASAIRNGGKQP